MRIDYILLAAMMRFDRTRVDIPCDIYTPSHLPLVPTSST